MRMGLEFLARVRRTATWLGGVLALMAATYGSPVLGLAFAAGGAWSLANLRLLERLVTSIVGPASGTAEGIRGAGLSLLGMLGLLGAGALLLSTLPPLALLLGFLLPLAVIVLKAAAQLLLGSRLWTELVRHRFRAALAVAALGVVTWFALGALASATAEATAPPAHGSTQAAAADPHAAAEGHGAAAGEHGEQAQGGGEGFTNIVTLIAGANHGKPWADFLHYYEILVFSLLVALLLMGVGYLAGRNPRMIPSGLQNVVETLVEGLQDFIVGILGPKQGPRFLPFLGTLFLYILAMNLFGLIPFMHSATANLNVTVALALIVFVYVQFVGFRELGPIGWLDHMLGSPRDLTGWILAPLMLPIHLLGELAKPISLSCRLFGNIFGEDMLLVAFASLGVAMLPFQQVPFGLPIQAIFYPLLLLGSFLQAMVFTVLSTIYILLMLPHEHHDEHGHEGAAQHAHG
jgi:F-type H+-transporting ATPase subunit a